MSNRVAGRSQGHQGNPENGFALVAGVPLRRRLASVSWRW